MSSRERWTVYPLLFLAIGLAVRAVAVSEGQMEAARFDAVEADTVVCRELRLTAADDTVLVHVGRVVGGGGGRIEIKDAAGVDAIAIGTEPASRGGIVEFFDADGRSAGQLAAPQHDASSAGR